MQRYEVRFVVGQSATSSEGRTFFEGIPCTKQLQAESKADALVQVCKAHPLQKGKVNVLENLLSAFTREELEYINSEGIKLDTTLQDAELQVEQISLLD